MERKKARKRVHATSATAVEAEFLVPGGEELMKTLLIVGTLNQLLHASPTISSVKRPNAHALQL